MWERPQDLQDRVDVDMMVKGPPDVPDEKEETAASDEELEAKDLK